MPEYEYAIVVHGQMFRHITKEDAEQALEDTRNNSSDPNAIKIIRRQVGEWEEYGNQ